VIESERDEIRADSADAIARAGIVLRADEAARIEVADFGLEQFDEQGLVLFTYVNTDRYCAKELVLRPGQTCPEHRHPPFDGGPGKEETFRCRYGSVHLYVEGIERGTADARPPRGSDQRFTVRTGIVLRAGEQFTIPPNTWHWFAAGADGAVVSEFSSTSRDELDQFTDPRVVRIPAEPTTSIRP
jgi:D-lyxose ketol-isomerase